MTLYWYAWHETITKPLNWHSLAISKLLRIFSWEWCLWRKYGVIGRHWFKSWSPDKMMTKLYDAIVQHNIFNKISRILQHFEPIGDAYTSHLPASYEIEFVILYKNMTASNVHMHSSLTRRAANPKKVLYLRSLMHSFYTLSLYWPSYSKFSHLSYEPGCSHELWCRKCATWLWNKYVLFFIKLYFIHIS